MVGLVRRVGRDKNRKGVWGDELVCITNTYSGLEALDALGIRPNWIHTTSIGGCKVATVILILWMSKVRLF